MIIEKQVLTECRCYLLDDLDKAFFSNVAFNHKMLAN